MSEIKLKAKRKNTDDWLLFGITELFHGENGYFQVCVGDVGLFAIDPATIQLANDPLVSAAQDMLACLKMALVTIEANGLNVPKVQGKIMRVIRQVECHNSNQCAASQPSCPEIPDKSMPICPIRLADDPRKHPMFTISCPNCDYEYMDPFEDGSFECPECELYLPPKKDPRKAMLNEIRESIYKYSYADWHRMLMEILDEMEAKL